MGELFIVCLEIDYLSGSEYQMNWFINM